MTRLERSGQMRNTGPRTFKDVVAAQSPTEVARLEHWDRFLDPSVSAIERCTQLRDW
jgi:hypothetical protein